MSHVAEVRRELQAERSRITQQMRVMEVNRRKLDAALKALGAKQVGCPRGQRKTS